MAKTFKNLPRPGDPKAAKPTSERDFFDLSDEREPVKKPAEKPKGPSNTGNIGNTSNTGNTGNTSNAPVATVAAAALEPSLASLADPADGVRQTFVVTRGHLEQLRDYVHARRAQGDYTYSQKQALQEALDLLFAGAAPAPPRPAQAREQEQQRRQRIQQGRRPEVGGKPNP